MLVELVVVQLSSHPGKMVNFGLLPPIHDLLLLQQNYEEPRVRLKPLGPLLINLPPYHNVRNLHFFVQKFNFDFPRKIVDFFG